MQVIQPISMHFCNVVHHLSPA